MSPLIANKATRMIRRRRVVAVGLLVLFCILLPAPSRAGSPTEQVRATVDKVLTIVRSSQPTSKAQLEAQRVQLVEVIYPRFDFTEMAKRSSVNKEWKVYDLVIEDISVVTNYRSQFDRVIARSSFEELVRMMKEKQS